MSHHIRPPQPLPACSLPNPPPNQLASTSLLRLGPKNCILPGLRIFYGPVAS